MVPMPACLIGYRVSYESIEHHRIKARLPKNNRQIANDIGSKINDAVQLWLVRVEPDDDDGTPPSDYYLCCFAVYRSRPFEPEELLAIDVPPDFYKLPEVIAVEENDLKQLFAPRAMIFSHPSG